MLTLLLHRSLLLFFQITAILIQKSWIFSYCTHIFHIVLLKTYASFLGLLTLLRRTFHAVCKNLFAHTVNGVRTLSVDNQAI